MSADALDPNAAPLIQRRYRYTPASELGEIDDSLRGTTHYDYDRAGRLTRAQTASPQLGHGLERFAWDAADNLLQREAANTLEGNRLLTWQDRKSGEQRLEYDPFGRLIAKHAAIGSQRFVWDEDDQLIRAEGPKGTTTFDYDPLGRRIAKHHRPNGNGHGNGHGEVTTRFVWDGLRMAQEIRKDGFRTNVRSWVYDPASGGGYTPIAASTRDWGRMAPPVPRSSTRSTPTTSAPRKS